MRILLSLIIFNFSLLVQSQDYSKDKIPSLLLVNSDAVVRLDQTDVHVIARNKMVITSKRIVTVLNADGQRHLNTFAYYDDNSVITNLRATVYNDQGGKIEEFKERDFLDTNASGDGTLYSDSRLKYLRYVPVEFPFTLVFEKTVSTPDTAFLPSWYFLDGYRISVEKSEFSLTTPVGLNYRYKENNFTDYDISTSIKDTELRYVAKNIKAIKSEEFDAEFIDFTPSINLALEDFHLKGVDGSATTWKNLGQWIYSSLLANRSELDTKTIQKIKNLVQGLDNPKDKIKKVYQFVQDNTRYISVQLGIGGWMPIDAKEVDQVKYGDCKGLTNYTMALLKSIGIESYYTIVYADNSMRSIQPDFPSLQGNHAFLNVPLENEELWLECTSQVVPVNFLGTFTDNRYVLKITPNGGELIKSRQYTANQSKQSTTAYISINENMISAKIEIASTGIQYGQKYGLTSMSTQDTEKHYKEHWNYINGILIEKHEIINNKDLIEIIEKVEIKTDGYISKAGNRLIFAPNMINRNLSVPKRDDNRNRDIVIKRGYVDEDEFLIDFPKEYELETTLPSFKIETEFGQYMANLEIVSDYQLRYTRKLLMKSGVFPSSLYDDYRNFKQQISNLDTAKIIFIRK